ncbi:MAG: hypothetical protein WDA10_06110 [Porticoccaceae bacterium]|jgi:hypothetical protein|nr:hypothetical protein [Porticoccaceae bacterium]MEA3300698.1 hypothetical protein [Pseudomonadota bacterium]HLS98687.1 hypothetical protein [Porticoccaceae bacterium]
MAKGFDPGKFQSYFKKVADNNVKAFEAQTRYFESLLRRNAMLMSELASSRINGLKEMTASKDISNAIKNSSAINHQTQEKMQQLYEQNLAAWEELQAELKELYAVDNALFDQMQNATKKLMDNAKDKVKGMTGKKAAKKAEKKPAAPKPKPAAKPAAKKAPAKKPTAVKADA